MKRCPENNSELLKRDQATSQYWLRGRHSAEQCMRRLQTAEEINKFYRMFPQQECSLLLNHRLLSLAAGHVSHVVSTFRRGASIRVLGAVGRLPDLCSATSRGGLRFGGAFRIASPLLTAVVRQQDRIFLHDGRVIESYKHHFRWFYIYIYDDPNRICCH